MSEAPVSIASPFDAAASTLTLPALPAWWWTIPLAAALYYVGLFLMNFLFGVPLDSGGMRKPIAIVLAIGAVRYIWLKQNGAQEPLAQMRQDVNAFKERVVITAKSLAPPHEPISMSPKPHSFCGHCGQPGDVDARFCANCGEGVSQ